MKQTEIDYIQQEGKVYITAIRNVASVEELEKEFGVAAIKLYMTDMPHYRHHSCNSKVVVLWTDPTTRIDFHADMALSNRDFGRIVRYMKAAGDRLQQAKRDAAVKVKTVKI